MAVGLTSRQGLRAALAAYLGLGAHSHSRFACPTARSGSTGIKNTPCGDETGDFSGTPIEVQPGPFTIMWEESIAHEGAPWRISLSGDGDDSVACPLLDHIPHDPNAVTGQPIFDESTYHRYFITIEIPDVACERCSLHLSNPMTDKIGVDGDPDGIGCTEPGTCFSNYHSCTTPLKITGTTARADYTCPGGLPADWPKTWWTEQGAEVNASVPNLYRRESATWAVRGEQQQRKGARRAGAQHLRASDFQEAQTDNQLWLSDAPARYREPAGDCALLSGTPPPPQTTSAPETTSEATSSSETTSAPETTSSPEDASDKTRFAFTAMIVAALALLCSF